jgi:hypothetical protein
LEFPSQDNWFNWRRLRSCYLEAGQTFSKFAYIASGSTFPDPVSALSHPASPPLNRPSILRV